MEIPDYHNKANAQLYIRTRIKAYDTMEKLVYIVSLLMIN